MLGTLLDPVIFLFAVVTNIFLIEFIKSFRLFAMFNDKIRHVIYRILSFIMPSGLLIYNEHLLSIGLGYQMPYPLFITALSAGVMSVLIYDFGGRNIIKFLKNKIFNTDYEYEKDDKKDK